MLFGAFATNIMAKMASKPPNFAGLTKPSVDPERRRRYRKKEELVDEAPLDIEKARRILEQHLHFCFILPMKVQPNMRQFRDFSEAVRISRKIVHLLRHDLPKSGLRYATDGSVLLSEVLEFLKISGFSTTEEKIVAASHSTFGEGKLRYVVGQITNGPKFVGAVGGHTFDVSFPLGSIPLVPEGAARLGPVFHRTDAIRAICKSGFISKMKREGGIHLFFGSNHAYQRTGQGFRVYLEVAMRHSLVFSWNRFSNILFCLGKPTGDSFDGKLPLKIEGDTLAARSSQERQTRTVAVIST